MVEIVLFCFFYCSKRPPYQKVYLFRGRLRVGLLGLRSIS